MPSVIKECVSKETETDDWSIESGNGIRQHSFVVHNRDGAKHNVGKSRRKTNIVKRSSIRATVERSNESADKHAISKNLFFFKAMGPKNEVDEESIEQDHRRRTTSSVSDYFE
jgi:hypothetical protein